MGPQLHRRVLLAAALCCGWAWGARLANADAQVDDVHQQTQALCAATPNVHHRADIKTILAQGRRWAAAWDQAERPSAEYEALSRCLEAPALKAAILATADDLTGAWEQSFERCTQALKQAPPILRSELWRCQAASAVHQGRLIEGTALLRRGLKDDPGNGELYLALAQVQLAQRCPYTAHETLKGLLHIDGGVEATVLARAKNMVDEAKIQAAPPMTPLDRAEQADLTAMMESGQADGDDLAHVTELAEHSLQPQLWPACALVLLRGPNRPLGLALLDRAERALPLDADPSRLLAVYHLSATDYPAALTALLRAVRKQPFDKESQVMLASVATKLNDWPLAHSAYKTLAMMEPERQSHQQGLALARRRLVQLDPQR